MKHNWILQNKKISRKNDIVVFFFFFQISSMSGLIEGSWILISASAFSLLQFVVLVEAYEEKPASYRYVIGQGKIILIAFPWNCVTLFLILPQTLQVVVST